MILKKLVLDLKINYKFFNCFRILEWFGRKKKSTKTDEKIALKQRIFSIEIFSTTASMEYKIMRHEWSSFIFNFPINLHLIKYNNKVLKKVIKLIVNVYHYVNC